MPPPDQITVSAVLKWIALQTLVVLALVVPTTWFAADYFYNTMGIVAANDPHRTVLFIVGLGALETLVFCPVMIIPISAAMSQLNLARAELERLASTDSLTGLLNRRGFDSAATARLKQSRGDLGSAALVCDIDFFKRANDQYGHEFGDRALSELGAFIAETVKRHDGVAARFGGEEFVVFLPDATAGEANLLAETLRVGVQNRGIEAYAANARFTVSIGVAWTAGPVDLAPLIANADAALYVAKREGRNRVANHAPMESRAAA